MVIIIIDYDNDDDSLPMIASIVVAIATNARLRISRIPMVGFASSVMVTIVVVGLL
jgi:hypothetical protein